MDGQRERERLYGVLAQSQLSMVCLPAESVCARERERERERRVRERERERERAKARERERERERDGRTKRETLYGFLA